MSSTPKESQESLFIQAYQQEYLDENLFKESAKNFMNQMVSMIIPEHDVIRKCKIFSIPDFNGINFDLDPQLFFNAIMATGNLLCYILLIKKAGITSAKKILKDLKSGKKYSAGCNHFLSIIEAAFLIRFHELDPENEAYIGNLDDLSKTIEFMTNVILVQRLLVHSRAFRAFVEVIGKFFINSLLIKNQNKDDKFKFKIVIGFIEVEKSSVGLNDVKNYYQIYLNFVRTVVTLYNDPQLPELLRGTDIITKATDFGIPPFFSAFIDFLTSIIMTPKLAEYVFDMIDKDPSEILSFNNFLLAIFNHPDDLQNEKNRQKLDEKDVLGLESVLRLLTAFFNQDLNYFNKISEKIEFNLKFPNEEFKDYLTRSLIKLILSSVPASLKAECFNCLASMKVDLWSRLIKTKILVYKENTENNENNEQEEGIISDIIKVEVPNTYFSIPQALSNLIASMLENKDFDPVDFIAYHNFLYRIVLINLRKWKYSNKDMKWEMLETICKAWINLLNRENFLDLCDPLYQSAISEHDFCNELIQLVNDDYCPVECLIAVYKLFLLLAWKENDFLRKPNSSSDPLTAGIVNKISRDAKGVEKMLRCFLSYHMRLQIISMELIEFISSASPIIVQVLLTKPDVNARSICNSLIKFDESENIEDFQLEGYDKKNQTNIRDFLEKDKEGEPIELNARCFLIHILIQLGSSSFFVRHICGFEQYDPPKSILETNLDNHDPPSFLARITEKLCEEKTHINYPIFVEQAIHLLLIECKHDLTINSTLSLLRSSLRSFFTTQLKFLSYPNSSPIAIGCFLQIMALENANSTNLSGIIRDSFDFLMLPLKNGQRQNHWERNVLFLDFIDRINNDRINNDKYYNQSKSILNGINDIIVAYLSNPDIISLMNEDKQTWISSFFNIIFSLLEKVPYLANKILSEKDTLLKNETLSERVVGTCSLIANAILIEKKFGDISPNDKNLKKLFTSIPDIISILFDYDHHDSRISAYSLLNTAATSIACNDETRNILQEKENIILNSALNDCKSDVPILRSLSFTVIESLIQFGSPWAFLPFLEQAIATTDDDWSLFSASDNSAAAAFCLSAKCRMYSKFLTTLKSSSSFSFSKVSPDCKIVIDEALIIKLSNNSFWGRLVGKFTNSSENEAQIQAASDILTLFSVISMAFNDSEDLRIQLNWFLKKFHKELNSFMDIGNKFEICLLRLYESLFKLLATLPNIDDIRELKIIDRIPNIFRDFAKEDEWASYFSKEPALRDQAQQIISQLMMYGIYILMKISEKRNIFTEPLFGEEWRAKGNQMRDNNKLLPLSIITFYLGKILEEIKESEAAINFMKKEGNSINNNNNNNDDNKNSNDDSNNTEKAKNDEVLISRKRNAASACLLIIWNHIKRWKSIEFSVNIDEIKKQSEKFKNEPYINFPGSSSLDSLILKHLTQ